MNCEVRLFATGEAVLSADLFAVTKSRFKGATRHRRTLSLDEVRILDELGPMLARANGQSHVTIDMIIHEDGAVATFVDFDPLCRIGGADDLFRSAHKAYVEEEPWLALVE